MRRFLLIALFGVVACAATSQANAYWPHGGGYFGQIPYYPYTVTDVAPYYAHYPPVYYSAPVKRSYGYSPYAYPGYTRTPNPMVVKVRRRPAPPAPKMIVNPYYQGEAAAADQAAKSEGPQVIYPAALSEAR